MIEALENGEADVALTVTDGFIVGKANGKKIDLLGTYVKSPLVWAVAGSVDSSLPDLESLKSLSPLIIGTAPYCILYMCSVYNNKYFVYII